MSAIACMAHLLGRRLQAIGDGLDMPEAERDVDHRVTFTGHIPHSEVAAELARARVGLCPLPPDVDGISARFTSPMKLLEMMAAGLPVVATDVPSVRAICKDGVDALLAPAGSPEAVASSILRLLGDCDLAARIGAEGQRRAAEFSWAERGRRLAEFCGTLA